MTSFTDDESGGPQKNAGEQLGDLFSALSARSTMLMTPLAGVIAGALAFLLLAGLYAQSWNSLNDVNGQLEDARLALAVPGPDLPPLDEQLRAWESALATAIDARVEAPLDSDFIRTIVDAASDTGVRLVTASAQREIVVEVAGVEYGASPYLIRVAGDLSNIQAFVGRLEGGLVEALEITSAVVVRDSDEFLLSTAVVVRNELPESFGDGFTDGTGGESISVGSRTGVGE